MGFDTRFLNPHKVEIVPPHIEPDNDTWLHSFHCDLMLYAMFGSFERDESNGE